MVRAESLYRKPEVRGNMYIEAKNPIHAWTNNIEEASLESLKQLAEMPFIFKHLAVMPDVHLGKGSCVGTVIPTKGAIIPAAVGVN